MVRVELRESVQLLGRKRRARFQHVPGDPFTAGRRGQRTSKGVIPQIGGQQGRHVDPKVVEVLLVLFLLRQIGP